jgi:uncharacterized membrane protein YeaQ/YmgE (transglycosylase-associated protein family)
MSGVVGTVLGRLIFGTYVEKLMLRGIVGTVLGRLIFGTLS